MKRYKHIIRPTRVETIMVYPPAMVEDENGEFVRYEDYMRVIEMFAIEMGMSVEEIINGIE